MAKVDGSEQLAAGASVEAIASGLLGNIFGAGDFPPVPVNVNSIAYRLGLKIKQGSFQEMGVLGYFERKAATLYISERDDPRDQAFAAAHLLGHYWLHPRLELETVQRDQLVEMSGGGWEREADRLAGCLLMPTAMVDAYWWGLHDIPSVVGLFGVSPRVMTSRLVGMGLIRPSVELGQVEAYQKRNRKRLWG